MIMDKRPLHLIYIGIFINLALFGAAYLFKLPFLAYHTGTVYITTLLGATGGILTAAVTFLCLACFVFGPDYAWFMLGGICIAILIGEQLKKETRSGSWLSVTGKIFLIESFCHILFTILFLRSVPFDMLGQTIFFALVPHMNRVFAVMFAGLTVSVLTSFLTVGCATLLVLCTPKHYLLSKEEAEEHKKQKKEKNRKKRLKKNRLQSEKNQD